MFPREGYDELYAALSGSLRSGQPALHRASYPVVDNAIQAITGGWTVGVGVVEELGGWGAAAGAYVE